jgi:adapter protein MecA 1/2
MRFSRIGEHTIKCIITEEEIGDLGFTLDEIMSNGERTQEFMNHIFDLAEQEFQMKFDMGVKTVRADFMSDHTLSLTFSEHPGSSGMMEHLKDIVNGLLNSVPKEKWDALQNSEAVKNGDGANDSGEPMCVIVQFVFSDMDILCRFARLVQMDEMPWNALYRYKNKYRLIIDLSECNETEVKRLSALTDEYAEDIYVGAEKRAFILEHGKPILKSHAMEQLRLL